MPFHKCSFPFTHDNRIYKKCAMIPNPSADNHYCHQYFKQRQINPKLVHSKPHKVTRLVLHNGTKVLCWEEGLGGTKNMSISTSGRYGWCKVLLVCMYIIMLLTYMTIRVVKFSNGGVQNLKGFCVRINILKGNH